MDPGKDQTYFLFGLTQAQLSRTLFPLGGYTKPEVRDLARELGLGVAEKNDSQEICFVPNGDYAQFLSAYLKERGVPEQQTHGAIVTADGRRLGEHAGVHHFTVGQRRGLGIAAGEPLYVIATDPQQQLVIVGNNDDLLRPRFYAHQVNWISIARPRGAAAGGRQDPEQARGGVRHPLPDGRFRPCGSGIRRTATRRHSRAGCCFL